MNRPLQSITVTLIVAMLFVGCAGGMNPLVIKMTARLSAVGVVVGTDMSDADIARTITYLDRASDILTASMPPDFQKAREMVKAEAPEKYRALLNIAVDVVELSVGPELQVEDPEELEKTRQRIVLAIDGFKEGLGLSRLG